MIPKHPFSGRMGLEPEGVLYNMSAPPRTKIRIQLQPVYGITVISLPRCLILNGLISGKRPITETKSLLGRSKCIATRLARVGCTLDDIETAGKTVRGVFIGAWIPIPPWGPNALYQKRQADLIHHPVCGNLPLSLSLLSRRIGNLYLSQRPPDFSPTHLVEGEWLWDDPRLVSPAIHFTSAKQKTAPHNSKPKGGYQ
jgi:hypothetical protein